GWILAIRFSLELQSAGARRVGECLDAAVITVAAAIERDRFDALVLRLGGDALADRLGRLLVTAVLDLRAHFLLHARGGGDDLFAPGRGDLRVDMRVGAMHGEAHRADFPDLQPGLACPAQPGEILLAHGLRFLSTSSS